MKTEIMQRLNAVQNVLDTVSVSHRENWKAMFSASVLIDETLKLISDCEISKIDLTKAE